MYPIYIPICIYYIYMYVYGLHIYIYKVHIIWTHCKRCTAYLCRPRWQGLGDGSVFAPLFGTESSSRRGGFNEASGYMVWHGLANISDVSESDIEASKIREGQYPDIIHFCSISKGFFSPWIEPFPQICSYVVFRCRYVEVVGP